MARSRVHVRHKRLLAGRGILLPPAARPLRSSYIFNLRPIRSYAGVDRRFYYPLSPTPLMRSVPRTVYGRVASVSSTPRKRSLYARPRYYFDQPQSVAVCVRRKARRSVMFATRRAGRGRRVRNVTSRFSETSRISCRP